MLLPLYPVHEKDNRFHIIIMLSRRYLRCNHQFSLLYEEAGSVHLFETSADVCGRCGMDTHESNGCCRDEVKVVKLEQDQNKTTIATIRNSFS